MSILQLLDDFGVNYKTSGHKHCSAGWANMECPFCTGSPGLHLGVEIRTGVFNCWRCGYKPTDLALSTLLGITKKEARELMSRYGIGQDIVDEPVGDEKTEVGTKPFQYPSNVTALQSFHKQYLVSRKFDPDYLEKEWGLMGTGAIAMLDGMDYKFRIVVPIFWNGKVVSWQTRDITGLSLYRYLTCPKSRERVHHKHIVYGDIKRWGDVGIIVEGVTDVWRLGRVAMATFGIKYKLEQVMTLARRPWKRLVVLYDGEPVAQEQARQLASRLLGLGIKTHVEVLPDGVDPASLSQADANHLVRSLIRQNFVMGGIDDANKQSYNER